MARFVSLMIIGLIAVIAFWINDIISSWLAPFLNAGGSMDPLFAFIIGIGIFFLELVTVGWIVLKIPAVARRFGA